MPKNKGMGGKNFKRVKNRGEAVEKELVLKEPGQEYAQVTRILGNGRIEASCFDGKTRLCLIRGKLHKRVWIGLEDLILVGLRDYQNDKADVLLRYTPAEARQLKVLRELPESVTIKGDTDLDKDDIVFEDPEMEDNEAELPSSSSGSEHATEEQDDTKDDDDEDDRAPLSH